MPGRARQPTFDTPSGDVLGDDHALWQIYRASFPSSERESPEIIVATVQAGLGLAIRARWDDATAAFSFVHLLKGPPAAVFLVYLVVANGYRSRGLGTELFEETWKRATARLASERREPIGVVWEVEIPGQARSAEERNRRLRRIAFFERLGATILQPPYEQPPVDGVAPVPMYLMFRPAHGGRLPDTSTTLALVHSMYVEKYQQRNGIPARIIEQLIAAFVRKGP